METVNGGASDATGSVGASFTAPTTRPMSRLANFVITEFMRNADYRRDSGVDSMLERAANAYSLRFTPEQMEVLRRAGIDPRNYRPLTNMKMRAAKAMLNDIIRQSGDKFYVLSPTPLPFVPERVRKELTETIGSEIEDFARQNGMNSLSPDEWQLFMLALIQRTNGLYDDLRRREDEWARDRCERMDRVIHDQMVEGKFVDEFNRLVSFICIYGTALMIGPEERMVSAVKCREVGASGDLRYDAVVESRLCYETVSPWDCYPAPNARKVGDGPMCIRVRYTADELHRLADSGGKDQPEGWKSETVRRILARYPNGGVRIEYVWDSQTRRDVEHNATPRERDCTLEGVRCFASIRGSILREFGISEIESGEKVLAERYYKSDVTVIAGLVVRCRVLDSRAEWPLAKGHLYGAPDSWWGDSIADLLYSAQSMQNNALKNIIANAALSSNGIFWCNDVSRVVSLDGSPALAIRAGKMIGFKQSMIGNQGAPVGVISVPDTTPSQLNLLREAAAMADDDSGIPQYTIGSSRTLTGAGRTSSGLAQMSEAACRVINMCIVGLGRDVIVPMVAKTHRWNLIYGKDVSIKGDVEINPSGMMGKILREAEAQRRERVTTMLGTHPVLSQALTVENFIELIRPELQDIGVNPDRVVPSKERIELYQRMRDALAAVQPQQQQQQPEQPQDAGQVALNRVQTNPEQVAEQGGVPVEARPGTVEERRNAG